MASGTILVTVDNMHGAKIRGSALLSSATNGKVFNVESGTRAIAFFTGLYASVTGMCGIAATSTGSTMANDMSTPTAITITGSTEAGTNKINIKTTTNCNVCFLITTGDITDS